MEKVTNFTQFEQKTTHISRCKIVHFCTIATLTVHICMVIVAYAFNILLVFFLSLVSALTLTLTELSHCLCSHLTSLPLFLICSHSHHCCRSNHASIAAGQTMPSLPPILSFITFSLIFFVAVRILRFWSDPLKRHDNAMNECFADQPSQPQQRRINLRNPLKWRGDERRDERVLRRS